MSAMGRRQTLYRALGQLLLEFESESQHLLRRFFGQLSASVMQEVYPVPKRISVDWMAPQATSAADCGQQIVEMLPCRATGGS
jgi:hypothetical protein